MEEVLKRGALGWTPDSGGREPRRRNRWLVEPPSEHSTPPTRLGLPGASGKAFSTLQVEWVCQGLLELTDRQSGSPEQYTKPAMFSGRIADLSAVLWAGAPNIRRKPPTGPAWPR